MTNMVGHLVRSLGPLSVGERPILARTAHPFADDTEVQLQQYATQVHGEAVQAQADNEVAHALAKRAPAIGVALGVTAILVLLARRGGR